MRTIVKTTRKQKRKIAVPTDFFPRSTFAMTYALALAKTDKSRVVAVHAVDRFDYSFGPDDVRSLKKRCVCFFPSSFGPSAERRCAASVPVPRQIGCARLRPSDVRRWWVLGSSGSQTLVVLPPRTLRDRELPWIVCGLARLLPLSMF